MLEVRLKELVLFHALIDLVNEILELKVHLLEVLILLVWHEHFAFALKDHVELFAERAILYHQFIALHLLVCEEAQRVQDRRILQASLREKWDLFDQRYEPLQRLSVSDFHGDSQLLFNQLHDIDFTVRVHLYLLLCQSFEHLEKLF